MGDGPSTTTNQSASNDPWSGQQSYLLDAFQAAQDQYNTTTGQGAYSGSYVAAPTQRQYDAYGNAVTQGYGAQDVNNNMTAAGGQSYAAGSAGSQGALNNLNGFASGDVTGNNIENAQRYAAGADIEGGVQAGMLTANRNASENLIPSIYRQAAASGGVNSDRAALSQGVVERGLAESAMGLEANLRNQAYTTGLTASRDGNAQQIAAATGAAGAGENLARTGFLAQNAGVNNQSTINAQITGGANGATGLDQQTLNDLMARYNGGQQFTWSQLQNLMGIVGGRSWGSETTGTSTQQTNPSLMQNIGSGIGIAGALFCDRELKNILCETGHLWRGFPEYYFTYHDDHLNKVHRGPMAQDVELTHPHAVTTIGGIKVILTDRI